MNNQSPPNTNRTVTDPKPFGFVTVIIAIALRVSHRRFTITRSLRKRSRPRYITSCNMFVRFNYSYLLRTTVSLVPQHALNKTTSSLRHFIGSAHDTEQLLLYYCFVVHDKYTPYTRSGKYISFASVLERKSKKKKLKN